MPEAQVRHESELRLVRDSTPPQVLVLSDLPASFQVRLSAGLAGRGFACRTLPGLGALHDVAVDGPVVLVLRGRRGEDRPETSGLSGPVTVVHVLEELTVEACVDAVRSGATGVVALEGSTEAVVGAVLAAACGHALLPYDVVQVLARPDGVFPAQFSGRDRDVLRRLGEGSTVAALAVREGVSEPELYRQLNDLYRRLGATDRTQALLLASRAGLLDHEPT